MDEKEIPAKREVLGREGNMEFQETKGAWEYKDIQEAQVIQVGGLRHNRKFWVLNSECNNQQFNDNMVDWYILQK